jgi:hypothetical protein
VDGLSLDVVPWMVDMGHGTSLTPTVAAQGQGIYVVTYVYFSMEGRWRLQTTVSDGGMDSFAPTIQVN